MQRRQRYRTQKWVDGVKEGVRGLGFCGLNYSPTLDEVDVGFRFYRQFWGNRYATKSAYESIKIGFDKYGLSQIVGRAMKANIASQRVLLKLNIKIVNSFWKNQAEWFQFEIYRSDFRP